MTIYRWGCALGRHRPVEQEQLGTEIQLIYFSERMIFDHAPVSLTVFMLHCMTLKYLLVSHTVANNAHVNISSMSWSSVHKGAITALFCTYIWDEKLSVQALRDNGNRSSVSQKTSLWQNVTSHIFFLISPFHYLVDWWF